MPHVVRNTVLPDEGNCFGHRECGLLTRSEETWGFPPGGQYVDATLVFAAFQGIARVHIQAEPGARARRTEKGQLWLAGETVPPELAAAAISAYIDQSITGDLQTNWVDAYIEAGLLVIDYLMETMHSGQLLDFDDFSSPNGYLVNSIADTTLKELVRMGVLSQEGSAFTAPKPLHLAIVRGLLAAASTLT